MKSIKKILLSELIINDTIFLPKDSLQYPWQWIANIDYFFKDMKSSKSSFENVVIDESNGPVFISESASIEPFTIINGPVFIGENCLIKSHSNILIQLLTIVVKLKERFIHQFSSHFQIKHTKDLLVIVLLDLGLI